MTPLTLLIIPSCRETTNPKISLDLMSLEDLSPPHLAENQEAADLLLETSEEALEGVLAADLEEDSEVQ
jgi:hypothetical protein